ncbi:ShlB/FhaC/HecB family hemolysin secretion/activation protein [Piscinibacter sakaiensis]|uniref:ShlB/FhaC/HecB family hemolysin secretion/activation protein n=1 Tax=Piscinibacter sakaiensis TaxID=1547922 RepID=UPI003AADF908
MSQPLVSSCHSRHLAALLVFSSAMPVLAQPAQTPRIEVRSFKVNGNTLLNDARIAAVLERYKGSRSFEELKQAAFAVQALYRDAGYGAVVAFVPEQTPVNQQVEITVIEGRLARINVDGQKQFSKDNILASLPSLTTGQTPRVREIDAQIQLANENPAKQIEVLLQPGEQAGQVDANIQVTEQPVSRFSIGLDNTGNSNTGRLRATFGYQHANLFGRDHVLALQLQIAPEKLEAVKVVSANYRVPLYRLGMAIDAYAAYSDVDGGTNATAAGPLQFSGRGQIAGVRVTKYLPRFGEIDHRVIVGLDNRDYINNCNIVGLPAGACGNAGESVSVQPLAIEYVLQKGGPTRFGASIGLQHNLHLGGRDGDAAQFQKVRPGSKPRYTTLRFGFFGATPVAEDWQLQARLVGQATDDALVPGEQFGIGGASSVRGYDEREITGDSGAAAALELYSPELAKMVGMDRGTLRLLGFLDAGWVSNRLGTPCRVNQSECRLASAGIGIRYGAGPLQARLDVAYTFKPGLRTARHDTRAHFSVSYSF